MSSNSSEFIKVVADGQKLADEAIVALAQVEARKNEMEDRRRHLAPSRSRTAIDDPYAAHDKFATGAVLTANGFGAGDAAPLAGVLALPVADLVHLLTDVEETRPGEGAGTCLLMIINRYRLNLTALGSFESWQRRLAKYKAARDSWARLDEEYRLQGDWRAKLTTSDQRELIRETCRVRRMGLPDLPMTRGQAADWIDEHGGNLNYRDFL